MSQSAFHDSRTMSFARGVRGSSTIDINEAAPQRIEADGSPTWITRGANFVVAITRSHPGLRLFRRSQIDEYMVYVPPGAEADVVAGGECLAVEPDSLAILPPGDSEVVTKAGVDLFRIFSSRSTDLTLSSFNASEYSGGSDDVAPLVDWPQPVDGFRIRIYPLKDVRTGSAFGRIYRCTNLMVNIFEPYPGSRDQTALSPHSHDDFEQGSLTIRGRFEHYLRTPWGRDRAAWREDRVVTCGSPSMTVIPSGMIHTTAWFGEEGRMIDIFAPPRMDFSRQAGWVRNEADYPTSNRSE